MASRRPWATMSGIVGWSSGNQSAGPKPSRTCASVKDLLLPGSLCSVGSGGAGAGAGAGAAAGAPGGGGGVAKPYAHGGGTLDFDCWATRIPAAKAKTSAIVKTVATLLINSSAFRRGFHTRILRAGKNANEN